MEDRPSKLQISVSSIREFDLTEGEIKLAKKQSELKRKPSSANTVTKKKSRDDVPAREQSNTSPERDVKGTASLSSSKKASKPSSATKHKSASSESAEKKNFPFSAPAATKSSSDEQQTKTQAQVALKDSKSKTAIVKIREVNNRSVGLSAEKVSSHQSVLAVKKRSSSTERQKQIKSKTVQKDPNSKTSIEHKSSSAEQHKQRKSNTALKDPNSKPSIEQKHSGDVVTSKATSRMTKSAGVASKPDHNKNTLNRKPSGASSAPAGKRQSKDSLAPTSLAPPGMAALSLSAHTVKQSKSKQTPERQPSRSSDLRNSGSPQHTSSKHSEHADHSPHQLSATPHPTSGRQHRESIFVTDPAPFPFHDTRQRTDSVNDADSSWAEQALETPTPWGGLGSEAAAALLATSSGGTVPTRRRSTVAGTKQGGQAKEQRRSLDRRKSSSVEEEQQCLSLSMARAVTDEHKRSFFTTLDDEMLEKLRERAAELSSEESQANALGSTENDTGSRVQLQETSGSAANVKRTASGRRVSSSTNTAAGGKVSKRSEEETVKGKVSGEDVSKEGSRDAQSKLITLENPFKKNKKGKDSGGEDGEIKNVYASALLEKWMAPSAKNHTKAPESKDTKQSDTKSKKMGFLKQLLGAKKTTKLKEKVLHTLTERRINLLIPQSLPDPRQVRHADQVPAVGVSPISTVPDSEAGRSHGPDSGQIQEEFFTSPDSYRNSIAMARQRMADRPSPALPMDRAAAASAKPAATAAATSTEPAEEPEGAAAEDGAADQEELTLANVLPKKRAASSDWVSSSSSEVTMVDSGGNVSRGRKPAMRRKRASSAQKHHHWKRKTSNKAYIEYQRRTDPRYHGEEDQMSHSTSLSLYPASSSEAVTIDGKTSWSDISSVQAPEPEPGDAVTAQTDSEQAVQATPKSAVTTVTVATSTDDRGRTEGTQTSSTEYLLLDRRSCLVKVLAALQRLNTDEALQVARILRRSVDEDRVYEDINVKQMKQMLEPKRSEIDATNVPLTRVESEKVIAQGSESRSAVIPDTIPDQDYDELTRIVSQIDLMVRSKLRITVAPYSLIYETLINYHLEITQDYSPSVAVFNYYLTEQGHPLFDDTSGFFRPTILQVARESLYPRLYARQPSGEPRELPAGGRLLDLQLLLDELLICPFCGQDVVWGQQTMCLEFCCDSFSEVIEHEYEEDLGRIRRQTRLWRRRAALGELDEDAELLAAALSAASSELQPPAKVHCQMEKQTRLRALERYGQDGAGTGRAPQLLPFNIDMVKKASAHKAAGEAKKGKRKSRKSRPKSNEPAREDAVGKKTSGTRRRGHRHSSEPGKRSRARRTSAVDEDTPPTGKRGSRSRRKRSPKRDIRDEVDKLQEKMGRQLTQEELDVILNSENVMSSDARGISITAGGVAEKRDVSSLENISERKSPRGSRDFILDEGIGTKLSDYLDADDEAADTESTATSRRRGKGRFGSARRGRRKTRAAKDREADGSAIGLDGRDGSRSKRADRAERESISPDDQMHYRLSESAFLEEGLTQLPWDGADGDAGGASETLQQLVTHPADSGHRQFLQERYPDEKLFVTWFDDGSGHVMYPSGEPAILVTVEPAGRRFVVLPDHPCRDLSSSNCVLAMFDPRGIGFVYSDTGEPRLLLDQREGWYHRDDGTIRRWHWSDLDDHVHHSPTLQPVIFAISRHLAIRVIRQDYIVLSFWANQRSARFNVGVTAEPALVSAVPGAETPSTDQYRLICLPSDQQQLTELRDRVRRILGDMARITDEPVKYLIQHQKLLQRGLSVPLRLPNPQWMVAEPRQPRLPGGVSAALERRSAAAIAVGSSARRDFLLQQMALLSPADETSSGGRRAVSAGSQPQPLPPQTPPLPTPLSTLLTTPTEVV